MAYLPDLPVRLDGAAWVKNRPGLKDALTFVDRFGEQVVMTPDSFDQPVIRVPRAMIDNPGTEDWRVDRPLGAINCAPARNDDQQRVYEESLALLKKGVSHIAECPTGWGKTWLGTALGCSLGQTTLIVVTKTDLMNSWLNMLTQVFKIDPAEIGIVQQNKCQYVGKRFVVGMLHSLIRPEKYPEEFYRWPGLVIFDEVHLLGADFFQKVCWLFPSMYRFGLSATPDRSDCRERVFFHHIGSVLTRGLQFPMKPRILVRRTGWKVPQTMQVDEKTGDRVMKRMKFNPGQSGLLSKRMAGNIGRNQEIVEFTRQAYVAGRAGILLLSDMIDGHLQKIEPMLVKAGVDPMDIGYYTGEQSASELNTNKRKRVALGTYQFVKYGTDVPWWDTLVPMIPKADIRQAVGRVIREWKDKRTPVVLDLVDDDPVFKNFYYSRLREYHRIGAEIVEIA